MNSKLKSLILLVAVLGFSVLVLRLIIWRPNVADGALDDFARCLSDRGAVMYGAYWCSHCQNEKKAFGNSFRFVNYVECTDEPDVCTEKKIDGYPTWIVLDGRRFEGEQGLEKLSELSGCVLPY